MIKLCQNICKVTVSYLDQKPVMIRGSDDPPHQASSSPNYETEKYFLKPKMNKSFFF